MKVVVVLGSHGGTEMCLGRVWVVTVYNCLVSCRGCQAYDGGRR